jgi:phospholipid/cholesterol/gamma-HCH transport system permease protein
VTSGAAGRPAAGASDQPPPSSRAPGSVRAAPPPGFVDRWFDRLRSAIVHFGQVGRMTASAFVDVVRPPLEIRSTLYQIEALGVRSAMIACITAVFIGMVMAVQFAVGLQKFGGTEYTGRIIGLSLSRELAPTLTAVIVGSRIGSGIAAELGSMAVTEQIDAIRSLGADPVKKLVVPRLFACIIVMPLLSAFALVMGFGGAMLITQAEFGIPAGFFLKTALSSMGFRDLYSGFFKTPFFGVIIAALGCHFGMRARGGTEGVGQATTRSVVAIAITVLAADFMLTKLSLMLWPV